MFFGCVFTVKVNLIMCLYKKTALASGLIITQKTTRTLKRLGVVVFVTVP